MFLQVAIEQSKTLMFEVDRRISDYTSTCDLRNRISAGVKKSWILMFVCVSSWKLRCLAKITHKHIIYIYIYDLWIYTRMKRDVLFTYRKKSATLWGKERPKDQMHPTEVGVLFFVDVWPKKKRCTSESWLMGNISGNISEHVNFYASKAAGWNILRCQDMMILY